LTSSSIPQILHAPISTHRDAGPKKRMVDREELEQRVNGTGAKDGACPQARAGPALASVMIEKFAVVRGTRLERISRSESH
jgi:hypothetical protein